MKIDEAASRLEALGNPTRLSIYRMLVRAGDPGLAVGKLQSRLSIPASTLSHHLKTLLIVGLITPGARCNDPHLPRQLSRHAGLGGVPGGRMLHGSRLRLDPSASRDRRLERFASNFDVSRRMDTMSSPEKTVAIIGAGPVGLAAAAHALETRHASRSCSKRASNVGACRAAVVARAHVLALDLQRRQGSRTPAARSRAGTPRPRSLSDGRRARRALSRAPGHAHQAQGAHPHQRARHFRCARAASTRSRPWAARTHPSRSAIRTARALERCAPMLSSMPPAPGTRPIRPASTASRPSARQPTPAHRLRHARCPRRASAPAMPARSVAVLGAGHSAVGTILDLAKLKEAEPATEIIWLLRGDNPGEVVRRRRQ